MRDKQNAASDRTAVRAALWRALHVEVDPPPHVLEYKVGLRLRSPDEGWRHRSDMNPQLTSPFSEADELLESEPNESCRASASTPALYFEECANRFPSSSHFLP